MIIANSNSLIVNLALMMNRLKVTKVPEIRYCYRHLIREKVAALLAEMRLQPEGKCGSGLNLRSGSGPGITQVFPAACSVTVENYETGAQLRQR